MTIPLTSGTLRWCVDRTNNNLNDSIHVYTPGWYLLDGTLIFTRSTTVTSGAGVLISPGDAFNAVDMIQIGVPCSGSGCAAAPAVTFNNLEIGPVGLTGVRGIRIQPYSALSANNLRMSEFVHGLEGGAIRAEYGSSLVLTGSEIHQNSAYRGGAISTVGALLEIHDSTLEDNLASGDGGAIHVGSSGPSLNRVVSIDGAELFSNQANTHGGAIVLATGTGTLSATIIDSDFYNNGAASGGALSGSATINDCNFDSNAADSGGALYMRTTAAIARNTFYNNAALFGGAVTFRPIGTADSLVVNDSSFEKNALVGDDGPMGGGVWFQGGSATSVIANSTFYQNGRAAGPGAHTYGGGVAVTNGAKVDLIHTSFLNNIASDGGGLYVSASTATAKGTVVALSTGANCLNAGGTFSSSTSYATDATCGFTLTGANPLLGAPAANGGPTRTMLPQGTSPLRGKSSCFRTVDQRGYARPATKCDIGSVEI